MYSIFPETVTNLSGNWWLLNLNIKQEGNTNAGGFFENNQYEFLNLRTRSSIQKANTQLNTTMPDPSVKIVRIPVSPTRDVTCYVCADSNGNILVGCEESYIVTVTAWFFK